MLTSPDFRELLKIFEKHKVRYLIVGGYAVMKYSEPRFTKDLDVFIATDQDNAEGVYSALKEFSFRDLTLSGQRKQAEGCKIKSTLKNSRKPNNWIHLIRSSAQTSTRN